MGLLLHIMRALAAGGAGASVGATLHTGTLGWLWFFLFCLLVWGVTTALLELR